MSSPNGAHPAPRPAGGAFAAHNQPTQFLPDLPASSWRAFVYAASRARIAGVAVLRWLYILPIALAVIWLLGRLPGSWVIALGWLAAALGLAIAARFAGRNHYVSFAPDATLLPDGAILPPAQKIAVYVTGRLGVEKKQQEFTAVPGFYRTFATREHALLCQVVERRLWGIATWPEEETGLWYAFFMPDQITGIALGDLTYSGQTMRALTVTYRPIPPNGKRRRSDPVFAMLHLSFPDPNDRAKVLADLAVDWRPSRHTAGTE